MGKSRRYRNGLAAFVLLLVLLTAGTARATETGTESATAAGERRIGQVYLNMPEVVVYGSGVTPEEMQEGEAWLGQEKLVLQETPQVFGETGNGIGYYVLVDISASISDGSFARMKASIQTLQDTLGNEDRLVLYAFGDEVTRVADGEQTPEEMASVLDALDNNNQETLLFEAIYLAAADAERETEQSRTVFVVLTDGEDFAVGKTQADEALARLQDRSIPVYAFGPADTKKEYLDGLGTFARSSGGTLTVFEKTGEDDLLTGLCESLDSDVCARYRAATNLVSYQTETFSLKLADGVVLRKDAVSDHWIPDEEAPYLTEWQYAGGQAIRLVFSEPLYGMDAAANYQVRYSGEDGLADLGVVSVAVDEDLAAAVKLTVDKPVWNGTYELTLTNLTDVSMEKNPLAESSLTIEIDSAETRPEPEPEPERLIPGMPRDISGILFLIFAALIVVAIVVAVTSRKKKAQEETASGQTQDDRIQMDVRILSAEGGESEAVWEFDGRLLVGRSPSCDICLNDRELSRRHFCLEREKEHVSISDLNSLNGTQVNGKEIHSRHPLMPGDRIEAGTLKITVRW